MTTTSTHTDKNGTYTVSVTTGTYNGKPARLTTFSFSDSRRMEVQSASGRWATNHRDEKFVPDAD